MKPSVIKKRVDQAVSAERASSQNLCRSIHAFAERPFEEYKSSRLLADYLQSRGFKVEFPFKKIPTAFRAEWGKGKPMIGALGEYDALPNCGLVEGTWGHGCGHNLLGTAPAVGLVAAKTVMEQQGIKGKLVYYGCPAEEILAGKAYMARDGAFRELDACLGWHPSADTCVWAYGGSAMDSIVFHFEGKTAHGASAHLGRSALDGVILMDVAVNYLREHVEENVRIHSIIRDGGDAPNVVPATASSWYYIRARDRKQVDAVRARLLACARGAAEATGTRVKSTRLTAIYNTLPNMTLSNRLLENLLRVGPPRPTAADHKWEHDYFGGKAVFNSKVSTRFSPPNRASSDEQTVSWLTPFCRFNMSCFAKGSQGHHRDRTAQVATPFADRGSLQASKVFAAMAIDLCLNPTVVKKAKAEFSKQTAGFTFDPLIPKSQPIPRAAGSGASPTGC